MNNKLQPFALSLLLISSSLSMSYAVQPIEKCFETNEGLEICVKQKTNNTASNFTQKDADQLAESLPKLSSKQITALQLLLQSQQGKALSNQDVQELASSLPKLPDAYVNALALYLQSSESGTANPKEVEKVLTEVFNIPTEYQSSLQAGLKLISEKDPSETDVVNLVTQLMKANDVPDEFGNTLQSYFTMINEEDNQKAEDQFMKAGVGLLKFIIKESKNSDDTNEVKTPQIQPQ